MKLILLLVKTIAYKHIAPFTLMTLLSCLIMHQPLKAQIPVPQYGCYLAAFTPSESGGHQIFTNLARKNIAIEMSYYGWSRQGAFPIAACNTITQSGSIPCITWMPEPVTNNCLQSIINGTFDAYVTKWALQIKNWGKPVFLRLGHEMNGNWSAWDGYHNGGGNLAGFGEPTKPDGPERFIAAYRHVWQIFKNLGVTNVVWIWCVNSNSFPDESWNKPENYYPGSDVVDWIGFDGYNLGTSQKYSKWQSFSDIFRDIYNNFKSYNKPIIIGEYASAETGGNKADWITDAYQSIKTHYTLIKAVTWYNINKETDWRINSSHSGLKAYQDAVSDPYFLSGIASTGKKNKDNEGPSKFTLEPAYPNPFNGYIVIPFTIFAEGEYTLEIRNVLGEVVMKLAQGKTYSPGKYSFTWNAVDENNSSVPSGIYFARLSSNEQKARIQKLVYIK